MYPLNMTLKSGIGFAVANDEAEHKSLTEAGHGPEFFVPGSAQTDAQSGDATDELSAVRKQLDDLGIAYHPRAGLAKLKALLP